MSAAADAVTGEDMARQREEAPEAFMSRDELAQALAEVDDHIDAFQAKLTPAMQWRARLQHRIRELVMAENAVLAIVGEYRVKRNDPKPILDRRIDELRKLYDLAEAGIIPYDDVAKAIWNEVPAPVWKTHLTKLRGLAKYGDRVREILDRGLVETTLGGFTFSFERIRPQIDVTPTPEAASK